ncbi:barstar family protein [Metabacillus endolithicus]|uniref:Barstar family protein n=1 Tax=Metabacillus endolithicus TaxID=1535204 RepID=A0ABW5C3D0_9BACI|nr:barstar family protein [Metabacillus endolithicus]UPG66236.1 barstar family protein [Metabacillus endolithicus]
MSIKKQSMITIDVSSINTSQELHLLLKEALELPNFYGENWDAFWDAITGLIELPVKIEFIGWESLEAKLPSDANVLLVCLNDFNEEFPDERRDFLFH